MTVVRKVQGDRKKSQFQSRQEPIFPASWLKPFLLTSFVRSSYRTTIALLFPFHTIAKVGAGYNVGGVTSSAHDAKIFEKRYSNLQLFLVQVYI